MKRMLFALFGALLLAACSSSSDDVKTNFVKIEAGYTGLLQLAANYTDLPRCGGEGATKICSSQDIVDQIRKAANAADATIQSAEDTVMKHPEIDAQFAVAAAQDAIQALSLVLSTYHIGGL
jgi:hypothetical protein